MGNYIGGFIFFDALIVKSELVALAKITKTTENLRFLVKQDEKAKTQSKTF